MCGIAGILTFPATGFDVSTPLLAMRDALRHRGPDDVGSWTSPGGQASLAHTRLSIIDLSAAGHQPMLSDDGLLAITFNGEIFNFRSLRAGLEREGVTFRTQTDTEVLLHLYRRDGAGMVKQLRGMFAFAIWDEEAKRCLIARDRFGIKPLYFAESDGKLLFASELRALLASKVPDRSADPVALTRYFITGSVPEPLTMVRSARMLQAGELLIWQEGESRRERWWRVSFPAPQPISRQDAACITRSALLDSVEHHFVSDVPVGIFLSGGVDSTALLALAHATGRRNIETFSIGVDDPARDESTLARRTAEHFGTRHTELRLTAEKARELFTKFLEVVDQPTIDGFNTFAVAGLAAEQGMKVVLSGLGGDELFAGYPSFEKLPALSRISRALGPLRSLVGLVLERLRSKPQLVRLGSALRKGGGLEPLYDAFRGIFAACDAMTLVEWQARGSTIKIQNEDASEAEETQEITDAISTLELSRYMRNQLLRDSDVMSMAHGLELRVPLVDGTLFAAISAIPAALRLRQGKQLLLDAVPEIPDWIRHRPKSGFLFPYENWLATPEWQSLFANALRDLPVPVSSWYQRWSLFICDYWRRKQGITA